MSATVEQIYIANPSTVIANGDLIYIVQSPYTPGSDSAIIGSDLKAMFLQTSNNLSDLSSPAAARANLGLSVIATATPPLSPTLGGTGVNNGASTITILGGFTFAGTLTGNTAVTFPTTGTLATTSQLPTPSALTKTDDTNVTLTLGGSPTVALLAATSLTLGWTGVLSGARGGTGVNNGTNTITLGGNIVTANSFTTSGNFAVTQTYTGITSVTFPTSGTLATTSQLPTFPITLAQGGTNASLTASNGGIFYSTATAGAILAGTATARQMLQSGANTTPAWSTATWPATTTANAVLFSSATNTVSEITSAASSVLITSAGSVPSFSQTLPSAVQTNITALGAQSQALNMNTHQINNLSAGVAATDAANVGQLTAASSPLTTKGDLYTFTTVNARLPVAVGDGKVLQVSSGAATGLAYSTPTYPSASGSAGTILRSDGTNNLYTTTTYPNTNAINTIMFASSANILGVIAAANSGVLVSSGSGVPSMLAAGTTGQVLQASTAGTPSWSTPTYPSASGSAGVILRSDGTNYLATTSTYPNTNAVSTLLYASSANVMAALATANDSVLSTGATGVPAWIAKTGVIGSVIASRITTPGAFTYTPTTGMQFVRVRLAGGSGGGGGVTGAVGQTSAASGGNAGGYLEFYMTAAQIGASKTGSVGATGAGGAAGNNNGVAGGNTTFGDWTAVGGNGGTGCTSAVTSQQIGVGATLSNTTGTGTIISSIASNSANFAFTLTTTLAVNGGSGGGNPLGSPLGSITLVAAGAVAGAGNLTRGGGNGAISLNTAGNLAGGAGGAGIVILEEFIAVS